MVRDGPAMAHTYRTHRAPMGKTYRTYGAPMARICRTALGPQDAESRNRMMSTMSREHLRGAIPGPCKPDGPTIP